MKAAALGINSWIQIFSVTIASGIHNFEVHCPSAYLIYTYYFIPV